MSVSTVSLTYGLRDRFENFSSAQASLVAAVADFAPSEGASETYEFGGRAPRMTEFRGSRVVSAVKRAEYTISNDVYTAALRVKLDDFQRNRSGLIQRQVNSFASEAEAFPNELMSTLIAAGTSGLCYDSTAFFGNSHPARGEEGGTQDNLLAGSGVTVANLRTDLATGIGTLRKFKSENGGLYHKGNLGTLRVLCPAELVIPFREALFASIVSQTSNTMQGLAEVVGVDWLSDANDWYLFACKPGDMPFLFQEEQAFQVDYLGEDTQQGIQERVLEWGCSYKAGVGYGHWQTGVKFVNT